MAFRTLYQNRFRRGRLGAECGKANLVSVLFPSPRVQRWPPALLQKHTARCWAGSVLLGDCGPEQRGGRQVSQERGGRSPTRAEGTRSGGLQNLLKDPERVLDVL